MRNLFLKPKKQYLFREEATSALAGFHARPVQVELEFGDVSFCGGRKTGEPREKPLEQSQTQQQTQPTYGTGLESDPRHTGWKPALSPLHYPCSPC